MRGIERLRGDLLADRKEGLDEWLRQLPGSALRDAESHCLQQLLEQLIGYYLVRVDAGDWGPLSLESGRIRMQVEIARDGVLDGRSGSIQAAAERLPIATDSVDVVLLQHTLDFCRDPHQVLREAERILIPEGKLIVIGFNPWGVWGLWRLFRRYSGGAPWQARFLSRRRLHDWLALLGFDLSRSRLLFYRPPLRQRWLLQRLGFLEQVGPKWHLPLAAVQVFLAVKRVSTLTPIRPTWKIASPILGGRRIEPTTRSGRG